MFQSRGPPLNGEPGWTIDNYTRFFMPAPTITPSIDRMSLK